MDTGDCQTNMLANRDAEIAALRARVAELEVWAAQAEQPAEDRTVESMEKAVEVLQKEILARDEQAANEPGYKAAVAVAIQLLKSAPIGTDATEVDRVAWGTKVHGFLDAWEELSKA